MRAKRTFSVKGVLCALLCPVLILISFTGCASPAGQSQNAEPSEASSVNPDIGYVQEFRFEYDSLSDLLPQLPLTDTTRYCEEYNEEYQATYSGQLPLVSINRIGDSERFEAVYKGMITRVPG